MLIHVSVPGRRAPFPPSFLPSTISPLCLLSREGKGREGNEKFFFSPSLLPILVWGQAAAHHGFGSREEKRSGKEIVA